MQKILLILAISFVTAIGFAAGKAAVDMGGQNDESYEGTIDRQKVRKAIRAKLPAISSCYKKELQKDKTLQGKVVVSIEVLDTGKVRDAKIKRDTINNQSLNACLLTTVQSIVFPKPGPGLVAIVDYPFVFKTQ